MADDSEHMEQIKLRGDQQQQLDGGASGNKNNDIVPQTEVKVNKEEAKKENG